MKVGTDTSKLVSEETSLTPTYQSSGNERNLGSGTFIGTINDTTVTGSEFGLLYENRHTTDSRTVTGNWKESGDWYALWSNPSYHTT